MTKIKICGIRRIEDINIVNKYLPDYIGFIFVKGKRRYISKEDAYILKSKLDKRIMTVGVFLNNPIDEVIDICNSNIIDLVQLHGNEEESYIKELKENINIPIIKAYNDSKYATYLLFDNDNPGSGTTFDWNKIKNYGKDYFLAGGISANNICEALKLNPYAIDVSSSVEDEFGFKDENKVKEIIRLVKNYER